MCRVVVVAVEMSILDLKVRDDKLESERCEKQVN